MPFKAYLGVGEPKILKTNKGLWYSINLMLLNDKLLKGFNKLSFLSRSSMPFDTLVCFIIKKWCIV